jgi:NTE family protein
MHTNMTKRINVVLQGGGVKGIALVGALEAIEKLEDVTIEGVAGASAGAIVAALYAAGYSADELRAELLRTPIASLVKRPTIPALSLIRHKGIFSSARIETWLRTLLERKGVERFDQLKRPCRIVAANVTAGSYAPYREGTTANVLEAVMQSLSIPIFFQPFRSGNRLFVDGGLLSNLPMFLFEDSDFPVIALKLVGRPWKGATAESTLFGYIKSLIATMLSAHDELGRGMPSDAFEIPIPVGTEKTTNFKIDAKSQELLYEKGKTAVNEFNWASIPRLRRIQYRDPQAAQILDDVTRSLDDLFQGRGETCAREYLNYHQKFVVHKNGSVDEECDFQLRNHGPSPMTLLSFEVNFDVDVRVSFRDLDVRAESFADGHTALVLPQRNGLRVRKYLVAFVPPVDVGEARRVRIRSKLPSFVPFYAMGDPDSISFHAAHERSVARAVLEIEMDGDAKQVQVTRLHGASARGAKRSESGRLLRYEVDSAQPPALELTVHFEPKP